MRPTVGTAVRQWYHSEPPGSKLGPPTPDNELNTANTKSEATGNTPENHGSQPATGGAGGASTLTAPDLAGF